MSFDLSAHIGTTERVVHHIEHNGKPARSIIASRLFDTDVADLWDAVTKPERLARWFAPVSGDLEPGGKYRIEGNASGTITECEPPSKFSLTWEFADQVSWVNVQLVPQDMKTRLELEHIAHVDLTDPQDHWTIFGPGAGGVGWELAYLGLALHTTHPETNETFEAGQEWMVSEEALGFYRTTSRLWAQAAIAAGESEQDALDAAERNRKFYSGEMDFS